MTRYEHGMVLIADDNEIVRQVVRTVLLNLGFDKVVEAENGEEAWNILKNAMFMNIHVKLIVSDLDMPELNGLQLLSNLRTAEKGKEIPFILLTAHCEKELVVNAIESGVTSYITKPFAMSSVEVKIRETLNLPKAIMSY